MSAELFSLFPDDGPRQDQDNSWREAARIVEALLFASPEPLAERDLAMRIPESVEISALLARIRADYAARGVNLVRVGAGWMFRTAEDLGWLLSPAAREHRKPSRAAMEVLAIIAYHQPTTRAEIEEIRGVAVAKGTLDVLIEAGWIRPRGRRRTPGRPMTFVTTDAFLVQFGFETLADLPGVEELTNAGLFDGHGPATRIALPRIDAAGNALDGEDDVLDDDENDASGEADGDEDWTIETGVDDSSDEEPVAR